MSTASLPVLVVGGLVWGTFTGLAVPEAAGLVWAPAAPGIARPTRRTAANTTRTTSNLLAVSCIAVARARSRPHRSEVNIHANTRRAKKRLTGCRETHDWQ